MKADALKAGLAAASAMLAILTSLDLPPGPIELPSVHRPPSLSDIPATLDECLVVLTDRLPDKVVAAIRDGPEEGMIQYHHGLGTWIRNTWGLWGRGPLYSHFRQMGLRHPDDMSAVILTSLWRQLHGQPLRVDEQIRKHQAFWQGVAHTEDAVEQ